MIVQAAKCAGMLAVLLVLVSGCGSSKDAGSGSGPTFNQQYETALSEPDPAQRARQLMRVGLGQHESKDSRGAEKSLKAATKAAEEISDPLGRVSVYTQLASTQAQLGNRLEARRALREAVASVDQIESVEARAAELATIAEIAGTQLDDADRASDILEEAEKLTQQVEDPKGKIFILASAAKVYGKLGEANDAQRLFDQAQSLARGLEDPVKRADALADTAGAMLAAQQNDAALALLGEAREAAGQIPDEYGQTFALVTIAGHYLQAGQTAPASELAAQADTLSDQIKDNILRQQAQEKVAALRAKLPRS